MSHADVHIFMFRIGQTRASPRHEDNIAVLFAHPVIPTCTSIDQMINNCNQLDAEISTVMATVQDAFVDALRDDEDVLLAAPFFQGLLCGDDANMVVDEPDIFLDLYKENLVYGEYNIDTLLQDIGATIDANEYLESQLHGCAK